MSKWVEERRGDLARSSGWIKYRKKMHAYQESVWSFGGLDAPDESIA